VENPWPGVLEMDGGAASPELTTSGPSPIKPAARFPDTGVANGLPVRCPGPVRFRIMCLGFAG
jgi:hypothetical protein